MVSLGLNLPKLDTGPFVFGKPQGWQETAKRVVPKATPPFDDWLDKVTPAYQWQWPYLAHIRAGLDRITRGEIDRLMLFVPPRHGKSSMVTVRYPVWRLERQPDLRVIVGAYNQTLVNRFSRQARRIAQNRLELDPERYAVEEWQTSAGGTFRAVGVGGGVTGQGGDLIIIDDPVKSREEAESETYRDKVYDWYTDDLFTRREPGAAIVLIQTRWHEDDLAGRILASEDGPNWTVINLPAEAEEDDPLGREVGAALCPERYDLPALAEIRRVLGLYSYAALYQQRPQPLEGGLFKRSDFKLAPAPPNTPWRIRYWDKAASLSKSAKYSAGVRLSVASDGRVFVEDVIRGQWETRDRRAVMVQAAQLDRQSFVGETAIFIEQEPGSSGVDSVQDEIRLLIGFAAFADRPSGDKDTRMLPLSAQAQIGNLYLVQGDWNKDFIEELCAIPTGRYRDQADAAAGAFNRLVEIINAQPEGTLVYDEAVSISPF